MGLASWLIDEKEGQESGTLELTEWRRSRPTRP